MIYKIGPHRAMVGTLMDGLAELMNNQKADIIYTDPPWGDGHLKFFDTMNKKANPAQEIQTEPPSNQEFLKKLFALCVRYGKEWVIIEYGPRWEQEIQSYGKQAGLIPCHVITSLYRAGKKKLPKHFHVFNLNKQITFTKSHIESVEKTIAPHNNINLLGPITRPGNILLDPCTGLGDMCRVAKSLRLIFYGMELNRTRLEKALKKLK